MTKRSDEKGLAKLIMADTCHFRSESRGQSSNPKLWE